jgi:hypothetical protein
MRRSLTTALFALACASTAACGEANTSDLQAGAAAALGEGKDDKHKEADAAAAEIRRKKFAEQEKLEAERTAKLDAIVAAVVKLPAKPSKTNLKACDQLIVVYENWIKAIYFDDDAFQLNFFDSKAKNLGAVKGECAKLGSIPATDCMIEVVNGVSAEGYPEADLKLLQSQPDYLFDACKKQFGPPPSDQPVPAEPAEPAPAPTPAP